MHPLHQLLPLSLNIKETPLRSFCQPVPSAQSSVPPSAPGKKNPLLKLAEPWPDAEALKARRLEAEARPLFRTTEPLEFTLTANFNAINTDQPLFSRLWASGFLPSSYQGVRFGTGSAPVLYLDDPPGINKTTRRQMLDAVAKLNGFAHETYGDP